jgi:tetratricopeptide (TPR) repeat protein
MVQAVSPDGGVLAANAGQGEIRLFEPATARELARLQDPNQDAGSLSFSPDGTKLLCSSELGQCFHVWDLRAMRAELADLGLDWARPSYPEALPERPIQSITVDLGRSRKSSAAANNAFLAPLALRSLQAALFPYHPDPYHERGHVYAARGELDRAIADFTEALRWQPPDAQRRAHLYLSRSDSLMRAHREAEAAADLHKVVELDPKNPLPFNNLGQIFVNGPAALRDPAKALALARQGLQVAPGHWYCRNTVGVAHYRLGHYAEAVVALERSLRESQGERAAFQLYFLAMSYARLGDAVKAHECYDQAVRWEPEQPERLPPDWRQRLRAIAAEADAVLAEKGNN